MIVARDGRSSANHIELAGAPAFAVVGVAGLQFNPLLIAGGYVAHRFWDLFHHRYGNLKICAGADISAPVELTADSYRQSLSFCSKISPS